MWKNFYNKIDLFRNNYPSIPTMAKNKQFQLELVLGQNYSLKIKLNLTENVSFGIILFMLYLK